MSSSAYRPYEPVGRPGGRPTAKPRYRILVHRQYRALWDQLPSRVGLEQARLFYDHVASTPGSAPRTAASSMLRGTAGHPQEPGFSRTIHYEISSTGRIDYQYNEHYTGGSRGDPHPVVRILTIDLSSH